LPVSSPIFSITAAGSKSFYAIVMTNLSFALVGLGLKLLSRERPVVRYLSDASYWMYLWHVPVLMFWQCAFMMIDWAWPIEFALILLLTCLPLVITYDGFGRSTRLGVMLSGQRSPSFSSISP
jgi:glucan biosynthesis protein C